MKRPIYLDYNGTTPHDPEVIAAMRPFLEEEFGNPSSGHLYAVKPRQALNAARRQVAGLLSCAPGEVVFTSGGTEANNWAIIGTAHALRDRGRHLVTSAFEHSAVLNVCAFLEKQGFEVTRLPVGAHGVVAVADVEAALRPDTILVTLMHANNEVGTLQPIAAIAALARARGIRIHTDAAQSAGKIPVEVDALGVDLLSIAGHKLYAPKGVGALYIRKGVTLETFMYGAGQESGRRAGTENILEIVGLGKACEIAARDLEQNRRHMQAMRDRLHAAIAAGVRELRLNGHPDQRLPNTLSIGFRHLQADRILEAVGLEVAASAGAACHAESVEISHVLRAMNVPVEWAKGTLRLTTGRMTTAQEVDRAAQLIVEAVAALGGNGPSS
ncbi:MAG: aminotransferase class V-fold PLP-dependent enzyme [Desulfobacterales bacterium]|jgi:cysteine desulfurase|nr:aminotransferase class V-fold PLP-dependent enzyme [Desulfobacterales bacterium]